MRAPPDARARANRATGDILSSGLRARRDSPSPAAASRRRAGASACYLSGAGPAVLAITSGASGDIFTQREKERVDDTVAAAMIAAAEQVGVKGEVYITVPIAGGAYVSDAKPRFSQPLVKYGQLHDEAEDERGYEDW